MIYINKYFQKVIENMSNFTAVGINQEQSSSDVRDYLTPMELSDLIGLQVDFENLQGIDQAFTEGLQAITSARQTIDIEIQAFNILDQFLYDPQGVSRVDFWISSLDNVMNTTELNPVNSAIAFGTKSILEIVKFIKTTDPSFQLSGNENRISELEAENQVLQAEKNTIELETNFSSIVVNLAQTVNHKHTQLQNQFQRYRSDVVARSPHVERLTSIINSVNIPSVNLFETNEIEIKARENLLSFWTDCLRVQNLNNSFC